MKTRRHHNNKGERQIRRGKTQVQVEAMAKRLGIPFKITSEAGDAIEVLNKVKTDGC